MTTGANSFIDIAVLDEVRRHFADGDPLILLSEDLMTLNWVNGPGASLLGYDDVETALGTRFDLGVNVRRQIGGLRDFPNIGKGRPLAIRMQNGLRSGPLSCVASSVVLPDGGRGILIAVAGTKPAGLEQRKLASRVIGGITAPGHYAAFVNAQGRIVAGSNGIGDLGITADTLQMLVRRVAGEHDRLVKRMIPAAGGEIAVGIARLLDDPATHLLIAIDDAQAGSDAEDGVIASEHASATDTAMQQVADSTDMAEPASANLPQPETPQWETVPDLPVGETNEIESAELTEEPEVRKSFGTRQNPVEPAVEPMAHELEAVRFVWRTGADGRFSSISEDFAAAVGPVFADVVGRTFAEVAQALDFDADGEIAGLLERRDTWSGRSVMWPLEGTNKRAPVDLAALPAYSRDREFEGFRGFGVIRLNEAVDASEPDGFMAPDSTETPDADGESGKPDTTQAVTGETGDYDPFQGEKPAIAVVRTPERRESDKVIRLASHRQQIAGEPLSEREETAFREIGERLRDDDGDKQPSAANRDQHSDVAADEDAATSDEQSTPAEAPVPEKSKRPAIAETGFLPSAFAGPFSWPHGGSDISILEQLPVAVLIRSGDELHYANPEFLKLTGYRSIAELASAGGFDVLFAGPDGLADEGDESARPAMRLVTRDGSEKLCEAYLRSVKWEDNRALMLAIRQAPVFSPSMESPIGSDADQEDRIQELIAILDTATDGVVLVNEAGAIRSLNRSAEALFNFESDDLIGKQFTTLFAVESQRAANDYLSGLSENGVASVLNDGREVIGREAQGRFIPLFMTIGKLPASRGYCAVMRDITHWKRAEEELVQARGEAERASSLKTDFLAKISHEVRTPLNAIIGFSELMMDEKFGPIGNARYRDYLRDINRSGNHVLDLVNDLLDISKIEAGEQDLEFESVSLNDALADAVAMMQPDANRERVIIRSSFASNLPEIVADSRSIKQIALNLLSNAIRFTPAGGQVIVSTAYEMTGDVILRVRDTGIGMSRSEIEQALKPFRQVSSLKGRNDGTGLGLPLTKAMVEANRAAFSIDSKPDEGTIVEVTFPSTRVLAD